MFTTAIVPVEIVSTYLFTRHFGKLAFQCEALILKTSENPEPSQLKLVHPLLLKADEDQDA